MTNAFTNLLSNLTRKVVPNSSEYSQAEDDSNSIVFYAVLLLLNMLIVGLLGKFLWNNVLVKSVNVVRPVQNIWQMLGLYILFSLFN